MSGLSVSSFCTNMVVEDSYFLGSTNAPMVDKMKMIMSGSLINFFLRCTTFFMSFALNCGDRNEDYPFLIEHRGNREHLKAMQFAYQNLWYGCCTPCFERVGLGGRFKLSWKSNESWILFEYFNRKAQKDY